MSPIPQRFAIPRSKDDFEKLCRDILRLQWSRPGIEIYGKSGEGQEGVDLLDLSGQDPLVAGQCKLKEEHKSLPPAEIEAEVNKAKRFQLPLGKYAILTTGKVSVHAQRKVRQLNQVHRAQGLFEIELYPWEKICELIQQYTEVHEAHYGEIGTGRGFRIEQSVVRVEQSLASLAYRAEGDEIDKLINEARDAINRHDYQIATLLLNRIEQQNGHRLSNHQRFRITANLGFAILGQGKPQRAAKYFLDALALEPDDEGARTNEVLAYYLTGDIATAYSKAKQLRPVYPASARLASYWILTAPDDKSTMDLEGDLSSILLADVQVRTALASKALSRQQIELADSHVKAALSSHPPHGQPHLVAAQVNMATIMNHETGRGGSNIARADLIRQGEHHAREAIRLAGAEKDAQTQSEAHVLLVDMLLVDGRKEEATDEARQAYRLAPDNIQVLLAQSQTQFANDQIGEGIGALERAYAIEPRADVAFSYGNALFTRSRGNDLDVAVKVLLAIDLTTVVPNMRPAIATQTVRSLIKKEDWKAGSSFLDRSEAYLAAESVSSLRGYLAHYQGVPEEAERRALEAQSLLSAVTTLEAKIFLARLFMLIGRPADALPLFQEAFEADLSVFDPGNLLDCAGRLHRDDVVIDTFRTLLRRGIDDWNAVSFGVQYLQKYHPAEALEVLESFLKSHPDHKLAKLSRSVIGLLTNRQGLVDGLISNLPSVDELPIEYATQVIHVLRFVKNPDGALDYAYRYLRLQFGEPQAHRAYLLAVTPFEPLPSIPPTLGAVEVGAAVRYEELPHGDPKWVVIEDTEHPSLEFEEIAADSPLALAMMGKHVNETFLLAAGTIDRRAVIRQIVPKFVRRYNDVGDQWQIRFPGEPMIEAVHLGSTEEQVRESIDLVLQSLRKRAETEVEMMRQYSTVSTSLHIFGTWHGKNAYIALIALAAQDQQPIRNSFGTPEERTDTLSALQTAACLVVDLSTFATLRMLGLEKVLTTTRFRFLVTEATWRELRETLDDHSTTSSPSLAVRFEDGVQVAYEETVEFKRKRDASNKAFLELVEKHCQIVPVMERASLDPAKREPFEKVFGDYGVEAMLLGARGDCVLWSDDLVEAHIAVAEFGARRCWTQMLLVFLADLGLIEAKERDIATAKLIGMEYQTTIFDSSAIIEAVNLADATPWKMPLKHFVREFAAQNGDATSLLRILAELILRIYREPLLPENRSEVITAFLDALWKNPAARRGLLALRANSVRLFGINVVGASQFNNCFDQWQKLIETPILLGR